jgi:antitoxin PrlF
MNVQRGKIVSGGRIQLPADVRRELALADGDTLLIEVVDGEVHLRPVREAVRRIQERMRRYVPDGVSLADELIADRRRAAADE